MIPLAQVFLMSMMHTDYEGFKKACRTLYNTDNMTTQDKVNELARKLVDELLYGPFKDMVGRLHKKMAENLEEALNKLDGADQPVAPTEPVRATVGCWLTRDGSKVVVNCIENVRDFPETYARGRIERIGDTSWLMSGHWNKSLEWHALDLLTFISPDVDYWEKEAKKPVGDGITDDTEALQAVLDKSKPFDWTQLPVSFVVKFPEEDNSRCDYPLSITESGIVLFNGVKGGWNFRSWSCLQSSNALWSTDRKTWREFK